MDFFYFQSQRILKRKNSLACSVVFNSYAIIRYAIKRGVLYLCRGLHVQMAVQADGSLLGVVADLRQNDGRQVDDVTIGQRLLAHVTQFHAAAQTLNFLQKT